MVPFLPGDPGVLGNHPAVPRSLGPGATLTTLYSQFEKEAEAALGLPPSVHSYALLPVGYHVVYEDRWGQPYRDL